MSAHKGEKKVQTHLFDQNFKTICTDGPILYIWVTDNHTHVHEPDFLDQV